MVFIDHSYKTGVNTDEAEAEMTAPPSCGEARNADVCEWVDFGTHCTTGCNTVFNSEWDFDTDRFEYCPYCGGNIDLVEAEM